MSDQQPPSDESALVAEIFIPDERELLDNGMRIAIAVTVNRDGGKWRVHKSDPDKIFPSNLHADRVDQPGKLDVYTGEIWSPITKKCIGRLSKKSMRYFYKQLSKTKEPNIQALLADKSKFSYLSN